MTDSRRQSMTPREQRLVAVLAVLRDQLAPVIDQITAGQLTTDEAVRMAAMLELIVRDLRPTVVPPHDTGDSGSR